MRRLRRWDPFQQMAAGDEQPEQGSDNSIAHQPCLMGEKREAQE